MELVLLRCRTGSFSWVLNTRKKLPVPHLNLALNMQKLGLSLTQFSSWTSLMGVLHLTLHQIKSSVVPWNSTLYIFMVITRVLFSVTECASLSLVNVAMITYLKEKTGSCGSYIMWMHISASVSLFPVGLLASHGYYIALGFGLRLQSYWLPSAYHGSSTSTCSTAS